MIVPLIIYLIVYEWALSMSERFVLLHQKGLWEISIWALSNLKDLCRSDDCLFSKTSCLYIKRSFISKTFLCLSFGQGFSGLHLAFVFVCKVLSNPIRCCWKDTEKIQDKANAWHFIYFALIWKIAIYGIFSKTSFSWSVSKNQRNQSHNYKYSNCWSLL